MVDYKTFDLASFFAGREHPKDTVTVFFDRTVMFRRAELSQKAKEALSAKDEKAAKAVEGELAALTEQAGASKFVFHLTGIDRDVRLSIAKKVEKEFPVERDFLGREQPNDDANEKLTTLLWCAQVERIETPDGGEIISPTEEEMTLIRGKAPEPALRAIYQAIQALDEKTTQGFDSLVEDTSFLSTPSPEG